ncbi:MAG TPA: hypothetical protein PKX87_03780 [Alphaproteobacteria bacterium]|nr:hypothetical protein [Alphaproteobacteria bacterium]
MPASPTRSFGNSAQGGVTKLGPSVILYQDFAKFLRGAASPLDPRPDAGSQDTTRTLPDKSVVKIHYTPSAAWDDIRFFTDRYMLYFENRRNKVTENGRETTTFDPIRITVEDTTKREQVFKIDSSSPDAFRQIEKMARDGVNAALSRADLNRLAERILTQGPGIVATFRAAPSP